MRMLAPYWTTRSLASDLFDEMETWMNDTGRVTTPRAYDERSFDPACDISEADEHYLMSLDLPGIKKDEINIEVNNNILTVSGERKRESASDKQKVQRFEKSYGFFKRSFTLPTSVDADKVEARYEDGVLELYLPKTQAAKPRHIEIQSGKGAGFFDKILGTKKNTSELKDVSATKTS
jgi:HSP20 family protein